jgi:Bacterial extracellular solute-binding protein
MFRTLLAGASALAIMTGAASAADLVFKPGEGKFNWQSYNDYDAKYNLDGQTIKLFGPWRGEDQKVAENVFAFFTAASGVKVEYSSSENYEQQIVIDTQAGSPPDIAILPQPGLIADLASKGLIMPLGADTEKWLADNYAAGASWVSLGTYNGKDGKPALYALPYKIDVKSLVWYSPDTFKDAGYEIPQTMEELKALTDKIVADGGTPWCIGLGSGGATGWPATDWVEDLMLQRPTTNGLNTKFHSMTRLLWLLLMSLVILPVMINMSPVAPRRLLQPTSAIHQRVSSLRRHSATCIIRLRSSQPSSLKGRKLEQTQTSFTSPPMPVKIWASRFLVQAHSLSLPKKVKAPAHSSNS